MLALMTQKSCAVGMRNAKLGNHLKYKLVILEQDIVKVLLCIIIKNFFYSILDTFSVEKISSACASQGDFVVRHCPHFEGEI